MPNASFRTRSYRYEKFSYRWILWKVYAKIQFSYPIVLCGRRYENVNCDKVYAKCKFSYPSRLAF